MIKILSSACFPGPPWKPGKKCLSKDFLFEILTVFTRHEKLHFLIFASASPVIPHGLWQQFELFAIVKLLTVLISVIQGGFEDDMRKMCSKYNLQIKK